MRVVEFREQADLERLRPEWDNLLSRSASDTIFLTYEWLNSWWTSYGKPGDLRILTAWDDAGSLRGIAPLRLQTLRRSGQSVRALVFLGDGSNDSDYLDFIIEQGYEQPVLDAFHGYWNGQSRESSVAVLNEIPAASPNLSIVKSLAEQGRHALERNRRALRRCSAARHVGRIPWIVEAPLPDADPFGAA